MLHPTPDSIQSEKNYSSSCLQHMFEKAQQSATVFVAEQLEKRPLYPKNAITILHGRHIRNNGCIVCSVSQHTVCGIMYGRMGLIKPSQAKPSQASISSITWTGA